MRIASAAEVRSVIAASVLGTREPDEQLGDVTLRAHQRDGLERIKTLLARHGGALLADDVGLGKTFVALATARGRRDVVVVAPAALRDSWITAAARTATSVRFVSVQALGRGSPPAAAPDLVIIDEAHHLRSARTRRFAAARRLCADAQVLLMSATPIQNRMSDLRVILSLFLGERAHGMSDDELATFIVRRVESDLPLSPGFALPVVRQPAWLRAADDVDCLDRIVSLPPPLPPADGDEGGVLLTYTLVRQWASSRAALRGALRRRLARSRAMEDALFAGRLPTREELAAWCCADGAQQLVFAELLVRSDAPSATTLLPRVREHANALRDLLDWLQSTPDPDRLRAEALGNVLRDHAGERVVAFSEHTDTIVALYRALASTARVAMLTHGGGRVAGGKLTRREVLARLGPGASQRVRESDRLDLLLTTDVLSEGVNLQDASVVVHLDLAWNPARLEQRVGRLRRIGAARDVISVYVFAPPAPAERLLQLEHRLQAKLRVAARSLGMAGAILPELLPSPAHDASAAREERIAALLRSWRSSGVGSSTDVPVVAGARSSRDAAIACVGSQHVRELIALVDDRVTDDRGAIEGLLGVAGGEDAVIDASTARAMQDSVEHWLRGRVVSDVVDLASLRVAGARRTLLHRVDTIARRAPRHTRSRLAPLMRAARGAASATLSAGAERVLDDLAHAPLADEAWLQAIREFAALHAHPTPTSPPAIVALLVLRKD